VVDYRQQHLDRLLPLIFPSHFVTEWPHDATRVGDQVMGAFFFVRRSPFEVLGGFDERFFVYYEDMNFTIRARKLGWSSVYLGTARAFHRGQGTTDAAADQRMFYFARSRILFAPKHFGCLGAIGVALSSLFLEPAVRFITSPRAAGATFGAFCMLWKSAESLRKSRSSVEIVTWDVRASPPPWLACPVQESTFVLSGCSSQ